MCETKWENIRLHDFSDFIFKKMQAVEVIKIQIHLTHNDANYARFLPAMIFLSVLIWIIINECVFVLLDLNQIQSKIKSYFGVCTKRSILQNLNCLKRPNKSPQMSQNGEYEDTQAPLYCTFSRRFSELMKKAKQK